MQIKFIRFNKNVKIPVRKHPSDTGADFFLLKDITIHARQTVVIPLGFGIEVPNGYTAKLQTRTSIAKLGIHLEQCAIDAGYIGEVHAIVANNSINDVQFNEGDRIGYIEVYPCVYPTFVEDEGEKRGDGCFGSTGRS